jgi:hypothetical protein
MGLSGECTFCGCYRPRLHRDHIIPKWMGGASSADNIQLLCANCHEDKTYIEAQLPEYKQRMSDRHRGKVVSDATRAKLSAAARLRVLDPAYMEQLRTRGIGRSPSPETRERISAAGVARFSDPAARLAIATSGRANWADPDYRAMMLAAFTNRPAPVGRPHTEADKEKMRLAAKSRPPQSPETRAKRSASMKRRANQET